MSKLAITIPRPTLSEEAQNAFLSLNYEQKRNLLNEVSDFLQNRICSQFVRKQEQERCEILIKLGASNTMILEILPSITRQDIQNIRNRLHFDKQIGRTKQIKNKDIETVKQCWQTILKENINTKNEFDCWLIMSDIFPEYTLGQLFNAIRTEKCLED